MLYQLGDDSSKLNFDRSYLYIDRDMDKYICPILSGANVWIWSITNWLNVAEIIIRMPKKFKPSHEMSFSMEYA